MSALLSAVTDREADAACLPRLAYVGDVPVRPTSGGAALLYRLLESYPSDRLRIVESSLWHDRREPPIPGVRYHYLYLGPSRPLRTRFAAYYSAYLYMSAPLRARELHLRLRPFAPQAILALGFGASWRTAACLAAHLNVPLHLLTHDDPSSFFGLSGPLRVRAEEDFGRVYRRAASRLCISPAMSAAYERRYGAPGDVLYPLRASDVPAYDAPPGRRHGEPFTVAYAGSIYNYPYARAVLETARILATVHGRMLVYTSPEGERSLHVAGAPGNVLIRRMIPPRELVHCLRREADVLLLPMSFEHGDTNMELSFPSKLVDYTAAGLPIVVWGPSHCSAVRWAREFPGAAEVVDDSDPSILRSRVLLLQTDASRRVRLGRAALSAGRQLFSHQAVVDQFRSAVLAGRRASEQA